MNKHDSFNKHELRKEGIGMIWEFVAGATVLTLVTLLLIEG
jgi:hypothetical protein